MLSDFASRGLRLGAHYTRAVQLGALAQYALAFGGADGSAKRGAMEREAHDLYLRVAREAREGVL